MNQPQELTFQLTVEETNEILSALGNQPFNQVFQLITKLQQQAAAQLQNGTEAPAPIPADKKQSKEQPELVSQN